MIGPVRQPGPTLAHSYVYAVSRCMPVSLTLEAGDVLLPALQRELGHRGFSSACLSLCDASVSQLDYVVPSWPDPAGKRAAWYSETRRLVDDDTSEPASGGTGPARIRQLGLVFGLRAGESFLHGHGLWEYGDEGAILGHVLAEQCRFSAPVQVGGWAFPDARFEVQHCPETTFDIFHPVVLNPIPSASAGAVLLKLSPNAEPLQSLTAVCDELGWERASVHGIGSLAGAVFEDGRQWQSRASEFLVQDGRVMNSPGGESGAVLDIEIVGTENNRVSGILASSGNCVLITAELVLIRR